MMGEAIDISCLSRKHYLMLPASDYPLVGCSPAEPTSVLSDNII